VEAPTRATMPQERPYRLNIEVKTSLLKPESGPVISQIRSIE
jgi:hypothetical protein